MRRAGMIAIVASIALASCTSTQTGSAPPVARGSSTPSASRSASASPCTSIGDTSAKSGKASGGMLLLTDVGVTAQACSDRVMFSFHQQRGTEGSLGFTVDYRKGPFNKDPSDEPMTINGFAFLLLRLDPASGADLTQATPSPTYTGARGITPSGTQHVVDVQERGDFEGVMSWVIGLDTERPYAANVSRSGSTITFTLDVS